MATRLAAIRCLVRHNAKIRPQDLDSTCFPILAEFIRKEPQSSFDFFQFLSDEFPDEFVRISQFDWNFLLWELPVRYPTEFRTELPTNLPVMRAASTPEANKSLLKLFEAVLEDHPSLHSQHKLRLAVIIWGGTPELIQRLTGSSKPDSPEMFTELNPLRAAVSVLNDTLFLELLQSNLKMGDDILSIAMSAIAPTKEGGQKKMAMVKTLVKSGAKLNGMDQLNSPPPPLHLCAMDGNMACAVFLLNHGAYPNTVWEYPRLNHPSDPYHTPLDVAADLGRLDIAHIFLKTGGFSARQGATGYDGAIERAEERGFRAIARLIRTHVSTMPM